MQPHFFREGLINQGGVINRELRYLFFYCTQIDSIIHDKMHLLCSILDTWHPLLHMAGMCLGLLYCGAAGQTCFYLASMFNDWALAFDILVHIIDLVLIINDWMVWHGFSVWPRFALSHRTFLGDPALCFVGLALILVFLFSPSLPKTRYDDNIIDGSEMLRTAAYEYILNDLAPMLLIWHRFYRILNPS